MAETTIKIKGDSENLLNAFKGIENSVKNLNQKIQSFSKESNMAFASFIGNLGSRAVEGAFNIFKDGLASIKQLLNESVNASSFAEKTLQEFNTALALSGQYSQGTSKDFGEFASQLQAITIYGDDAILKNAALLQSLANLDNEGLKKATKSAIDLAAGMGISLTQAFQALGKAANGETMALKQFGIYVNKTGDDAKDFQVVLDTITKQFGGAAQAATYTYAGALTQLNEVYGDTQEVVGAFITQNPLVIAGFSAAKDILLALQEVLKKNNESFKSLVDDAFMALVSVLPDAIKLIDILIGSFRTLQNSTSYIADKFFALQETMIEINLAIAKTAEHTAKLVNSSRASAINDEVLAYQRKLDVIQQARLVNQQEVAERIAGQEKVSEILTTFSDKAVTILNDRLAKTKQMQNEGTEHYLANLSKQNEGHKKITKSMIITEQEYQKKKRDEQKKHEKELEGQRKEKLELGGKVFSGMASGAAGAGQVISGAVGTAANMMIPGSGAVIGPLIQLLGMQTDQMKSAIRGFIDGAADFILNIIENIPVFIDEIINGIPRFLDRLIAGLPRVLESVIKMLPVLANSVISYFPKMINALIGMLPGLVTSLASNLLKSLPEIFKSFGADIFKSFFSLFSKFEPMNLLSKIFKFDGGGKGAVESFLGFDFPFLKFAKGGLIGGKTNGVDSEINDIVPALLSRGEVVLPKSVVNGGADQVISFMRGLGLAPNKFGFGDFISDAFDSLGDVAETFTDAFGNIIEGVSGGDVDKIKSGLKGVTVDTLSNFTDLGINFLPEPLKGILKSLKSLGAELSIRELISNPVRAITSAVRSLIETSLKNPLKRVLQAPKLANGGEFIRRVPDGFPNDTYPARLTQNELVVDRSTTQKLKTFLEGSGNNNELNTALLVKILDALQSPFQVNSSINLNNRTFAQLLLELNRTNARTA